MASERLVHECGCGACQRGEQPEKNDHRDLNLILSRSNEQQRRWIVGREARRRGHGGIQQVAEITGLHPETIRRGRDELDQQLKGRPTDRVRLPGGGRPRVEKKIPRCRKILLALYSRKSPAIRARTRNGCVRGCGACRRR